jgi:hypothetical protein
MADDYARHALSQRASFEATHPAVMAAAGRLASECVLRVADLGAADGVNSHGLIRDLVAQRAGRPLIYALVDLPTNAWRVALKHPADPARHSRRVIESRYCTGALEVESSGENRTPLQQSLFRIVEVVVGPCHRVAQCVVALRAAP